MKVMWAEVLDARLLAPLLQDVVHRLRGHGARRDDFPALVDRQEEGTGGHAPDDHPSVQFKASRLPLLA